ncbi:hypothetical protein [Selenihalanaerobacter shriftii]|uniref:Uncharacterized protein n=1 Tax=Selenihalanaerobacter shriftii TaxID=142842 RepID=A0A1T4K8I3_9FIRM|nr:hypothetical protein [Selenihalanaerobacter shriftii]SJZ38633.1 hypothetical protein SAMN02745118_00681 [Selenihalanaerobacter shriftii]
MSRQKHRYPLYYKKNESCGCDYEEPKKQKKYKPQTKNCILKVIKQLDETDRITVILKSGDECCLWSGCFGGLDDGCLWIYNICGGVPTEPTECRRMYIPLECICAIIDPAIEFVYGG